MPSPDDLYSHTWNWSDLGEALDVTARSAQLYAPPRQPPRPPPELAASGRAAQERWLLAAADTLGLEAEPVMASFGDLISLAEDGAPAILYLPPRAPSREPRFLCLAGKGTTPRVLSSDLTSHAIPADVIVHELAYPIIAPFLPQAEMLLDQVRVPPARRARARRLIIQQQMGNLPFFCGWLLRLAPSAGVAARVRVSRVWLHFVELLLAQFVLVGILLVAWALIGRIAFTDQANGGWVQIWMLVLLTGVPAQLWVSRAQNRFVTQLGILFRERLLYGTLQLHPDEIRHEGFGHFFERVMFADRVQALVLGGGLTALLALAPMVAAVFILAVGAGGIVQALTLLVFILAIVALAWNYARSNESFDRIYRKMTNDLAERMIGHRTRLVQQAPTEWHTHEDDELERYFAVSQRLDRASVLIDALPRAWIAVGIIELALSFLGSTATATGLALSLGGILLAFTSLTTIAMGFKSFVNAVTAWREVGPLFRAAVRPTALTQAALEQASLAATRELVTNEPIVRVRNVTYRYTEHTPPVLSDISCDIFANDRILLQGPSGGGKTTLAAVLAGLRQPNAGLILTRGLNRQNINTDALPRRTAMAPQFHENHIFTAPLSFNLLIGRRWPPTEQDIAEAEQLCNELGLGDLIRRLPGGMSQIVGDGGWQLSHGERSRVFIARALLQAQDLLILDESFGALDPENLQRALETTLRRAPALIVIAHP